MGTSATYAIRSKNGRYMGTHVHKDGGFGWTGRILIESYDTIEKISELIALGACSSIGHTLEECVAYHRDRAESWMQNKPVGWATLGLVRTACPSDYTYIFDQRSGAWLAGNSEWIENYLEIGQPSLS